ncbi:hypothetical protein [Anaeromyxobacter oryzae]|uniref:hypothetical protein n=1 Tax=Anaeromyxobacter oryzae TaxID=2918170 RepID=UPI0020C15291|nr:hypothetical protein [Anaeromyxobacter oryzae]
MLTDGNLRRIMGDAEVDQAPPASDRRGRTTKVLSWASFALAYAASRVAYYQPCPTTWWDEARWSLFALMLVLAAWVVVEHGRHRWLVTLGVVGGTLLAHRELLLIWLSFKVMLRWRNFAP